MATITGDIITDAVVNLKTALDTQITTWEVSEVFRYQSDEVGKRGDGIALEIVSWQPVVVMVASPNIVVDHRVGIRVWYIHSTGVRADAAFDEIYSKLSKIAVYLLENPMPNGYGSFLNDQEFPRIEVEPVGAIERVGGGLLAGKFTIVHTYTKTHTQTFA